MTDPRVKAGAYITNGTDLYEVHGIDATTGRLELEDVRTGVILAIIPTPAKIHRYALVKPADNPHR